MAGILFIFSAPSGSGKSTLVSELRKQVKDVDFSISWTTRPPRGSEENGREYHFTSKEEFERMIQEGKFLEYAQVFGNHYYGTARQSLEEARRLGHDLLLDIDVQGAAQVRSQNAGSGQHLCFSPDAESAPHSLRNRMRAEGDVNEAELYRRLSEAAKEIENYRNYSYILINDILDRAVAQLEAIVLAERYYRNAEPIAYRSSRVLEVAAGCRLSNSRERLKPVLEAFGIEGGNGQQQLPFGDDPDDD